KSKPAAKKKPAVSKKVAKKAVAKTTAKKATPKKTATKTTKTTASAKTQKKLTRSEKLLEIKAAELMQLGRERGYVTYDELLRSFPEIEKNVDFLDVLY